MIFPKDIIKSTEATVSYFLPHCKEHRSWHQLKRLHRNSLILNWRNNPEAIKAVGSKSTLVRHVNFLIQHGVIITEGDNIRLVGINTLLKLFGQSKTVKLDNDTLELRFVASHLKTSERKQAVASKLNESEKSPTQVIKYQTDIANGFVTTATCADINYSCRTLSQDLGAPMFNGKYSPTVGWRMFQKLQQAGFIILWRRKKVVTDKHPYLSYEFETKINTQVERDENWSNFAVYW